LEVGSLELRRFFWFVGFDYSFMWHFKIARILFERLVLFVGKILRDYWSHQRYQWVKNDTLDISGGLCFSDCVQDFRSVIVSHFLALSF
jgi:hypothetical protein